MSQKAESNACALLCAPVLSSRHPPRRAGPGRAVPAGLRGLLAAQKVMNKQGKMVIRHVNETIQEVFEITGFIDILTIE